MPKDFFLLRIDDESRNPIGAGICPLTGEFVRSSSGHVHQYNNMFGVILDMSTTN